MITEFVRIFGYFSFSKFGLVKDNLLFTTLLMWKFPWLNLPNIPKLKRHFVLVWTRFKTFVKLGYTPLCNFYESFLVLICVKIGLHRKRQSLIFLHLYTGSQLKTLGSNYVISMYLDAPMTTLELYNFREVGQNTLKSSIQFFANIEKYSHDVLTKKCLIIFFRGINHFWVNNAKKLQNRKKKNTWKKLWLFCSKF